MTASVLNARRQKAAYGVVIMKICERIEKSLGPRCDGILVRDVRIGLGYSAVQLEDGRTGVAFTFSDRVPAGCCQFLDGPPLAGRKASDLLKFVGSAEILKSALGLATANALANVQPENGVEGDVLDALRLLSGDRVAMIGYFVPLLTPLENRVSRVDVYDEIGLDRPGAAPASEALDGLSHADVALITSTSIINNTIDELLEAAGNCRETVLLGASTPLLPEAFSGSPVTMLCGITITEPASVLRVVSEGGGTRFFKSYSRKWNLPIGER